MIQDGCRALTLPSSKQLLTTSSAVEKVLAIGATTVKLQAVSPPPAGAANPARSDGALSCAVLVIEMPGYAACSVADQLLRKQRLNSHLAVALEGIPADQRIVLDTGAGIAITFLESPLGALDVLRALLANRARGGEMQDSMTLHGALNLGPIRVVAESNAHVNILGDGISVAQRLLAFAKPDQILVAKTYVEAALAQDTALASLFVYQGSRTDAHVRDHEIFELDGVTLTSAPRLPHGGPPDASSVSAAAKSGKSRSFAFAFAGLSAITLTAMIVHLIEREIPAIHLGSTPTKSPLQVANTPLRAVSRIQPVASRAIEPSPEHADRASERAGSDVQRAGAQSSSTASTTAAASPIVTEAAQAVPPASGAADVAGTTTRTVTFPATRAPDRQVRPTALRAAVVPHAEPRRKSTATSAQVATAAVATPNASAAPSPHESAPLTAWQPVESVSPSATSAATQPGKPATTASALVTLAISPWGEVFVDGRSMGVSPPLREFELPVGKHKVVVRNGGFKAFEQDLDLISHQTIKVKHKFAQGS